ncbi:hypothetical protein TNCV_2325681 [Trichonephila clavipes]|nr:hypothetical protein TNCV_2325681 [Trichonephila clavipes]
MRLQSEVKANYCSEILNLERNFHFERKVILTSPSDAVRGLLVTDLVISNYDQVTRLTPRLTHTKPTGGRLSLDIFDVQRPALHGESSAALGLNSQHASQESVTLTTRLPRPHNFRCNLIPN